jgi:hypothetical protein
MLSILTLYTKRCYADCRLYIYGVCYAECHYSDGILLADIMLTVVMLSVIMLSEKCAEFHYAEYIRMSLC